MDTVMHGSTALTLKDRLSRLTYQRARALLGPEGSKLIQAGAKWEIDLDRDVKLSDEALSALGTMAASLARALALRWLCNRRLG